MKPMTLKITNPPPTLVAQLMHDTTTASLETDTNTSGKHENVNQVAEIDFSSRVFLLSLLIEFTSVIARRLTL